MRLHASGNGTGVVWPSSSRVIPRWCAVRAHRRRAEPAAVLHARQPAVLNELQLALKTLESGNRTLVYYYAPGHLNGDGETAADEERVSDLIGCPMQRGEGASTLKTTIISRSTVSGFASLRELTYGTEQMIPPSTAKSQAYAPWYHLIEDDAAKTPGNTTCTCSILGRYNSSSSNTRGSSGKASLVLAEWVDHRVIFSAAPLPPQALRILAMDAGVHMFLDGEHGVEASGKALLLRGSANASIVNQHKVALPPHAGGWTVRNASGALVCRGCEAFETSLEDGETQFWFVE